MLLAVPLAVIFAFAAAPVVVADSSCSSDCAGCTSRSVEVSDPASTSLTCKDSSATPVITSVDVTSNSDSFTITLMDEANFDKYKNGQNFETFSISGTGPVDVIYSCFHKTFRYDASVGPVYIVFNCKNIWETCLLQYKVDITCQSACAGIDCNGNGYCSDGKCICNNGYTGTHCDRNDCLSNCNHGYCSGSTCNCDEGYSGRYCDFNECHSSCESGYCSGSTCICYSGYSGFYCTYYGDDDSGRAMTIGLICGGVALLVIIVVVVVVVVLYRRRRRRSGDIELVNEVTPQ